MKKDLTVKEVAEHLGFKEDTIRRWLETSFLPGMKIRGHWRVDAEHFALWRKQQQNAA